MSNYVKAEENMNFEQGKQFCIDSNLTLVTLGSEEETDIIEGMLKYGVIILKIYLKKHDFF